MSCPVWFITKEISNLKSIIARLTTILNCNKVAFYYTDFIWSLTLHIWKQTGLIMRHRCGREEPTMRQQKPLWPGSEQQPASRPGRDAPCRQPHRRGWPGRCTGPRCSPPWEPSACTSRDNTHTHTYYNTLFIMYTHIRYLHNIMHTHIIMHAHIIKVYTMCIPYNMCILCYVYINVCNTHAYTY